MYYLIYYQLIWVYVVAKPFISFNAPDFLKYGLIGLGALLGMVAGKLLRLQLKSKGTTKPVYIFMGFSLIILTLGLISENAKDVLNLFVPKQMTNLVDSLPTESTESYSIIKDNMVYDLRAWKEVDTSKKAKQSPTNVLNYLHVKKVLPVDTITAHYATSGIGIDLRCITQNYLVYEKKHRSHNGRKSYGIAIDVADVPLNTEFLIIVEATYWNGFYNLDSADASTYTDLDVSRINELSMIVLLPDNKPLKGIPKAIKEKDDKISVIRSGPFVDPNNRYVYWSIKPIEPDTHYTLQWFW